MTTEFEIALTLISAFLVAIAMMPVAKAVSLRFGIVAQPSTDRPHDKPTALLGGMAVLAGFVVAIGFVGILSGLPYHSIPWLAGFAVAMCLVGLLDEHPRVAIAQRMSDDRDKFVAFYEKLTTVETHASHL